MSDTPHQLGVIHHPATLVHREGRRSLAVIGVILSIVLAAQARVGGRLPRRSAFSALLSFAFLAQFFRDPGCDTPLEPDRVTAPAHGRVVHIGIEDEPEILPGPRLRISIFLSVFNPHVTRAPIGGRVTYQRYHEGRYLVALHPKSSTLNERCSILIEREGGTAVLVRQIAGLLARRIRTYTHLDSVIGPGDDIGFIKLGSRVDVFLPPDAEVLVSVGQHVRAGESAIARLPRRV